MEVLMYKIYGTTDDNIKNGDILHSCRDVYNAVTYARLYSSLEDMKEYSSILVYSEPDMGIIYSIYRRGW
jgi:hypothetical protein